LAEVLITLAIIGVIAAITIPSIVANHQKTALETQFAKTYRTLSQAINLAIAEHGGMESWDWNDNLTNEYKDNLVKKYFLPNLNSIKFCPSDNSVTGCFPNVTYKKLSGGNWSNISIWNHPKILLADGTSIFFSFTGSCIKNNTHCLLIAVDTNGEKKPNTIGLDYFEFPLYPITGEFLPLGINGSFNTQKQQYDKYTKEEMLTGCNRESGGGWQCGARIIDDGFKINY